MHVGKILKDSLERLGGSVHRLWGVFLNCAKVWTLLLAEFAEIYLLVFSTGICKSTDSRISSRRCFLQIRLGFTATSSTTKRTCGLIRSKWRMVKTKNNNQVILKWTFTNYKIECHFSKLFLQKFTRNSVSLFCQVISILVISPLSNGSLELNVVSAPP